MAAPFQDVNLCEDDTLMLSFDKTENQDWCLDLLKTSLLKTTLTGIMSSKFQTALKEKYFEIIIKRSLFYDILLLESPCFWLVGPSITFFTPSKICGINGGSRYGFDTVANEVDGEVTEEMVD